MWIFHQNKLQTQLFTPIWNFLKIYKKWFKSKFTTCSKIAKKLQYSLWTSIFCTHASAASVIDIWNCHFTEFLAAMHLKAEHTAIVVRVLPAATKKFYLQHCAVTLPYLGAVEFFCSFCFHVICCCYCCLIHFWLDASFLLRI